MHAAVNGSGYDVGRIRADFPILGMQVHGKPLVYLDNAASAQKPQAVLDRMNQNQDFAIKYLSDPQFRADVDRVLLPLIHARLNRED